MPIFMPTVSTVEQPGDRLDCRTRAGSRFGRQAAARASTGTDRLVRSDHGGRRAGAVKHDDDEANGGRDPHALSRSATDSSAQIVPSVSTGQPAEVISSDCGRSCANATTISTRAAITLSRLAPRNERTDTQASGCAHSNVRNPDERKKICCTYVPADSDCRIRAAVIESHYPAGMSLDAVARHPVALVEFPADDPEQALRFWVGVLGVDLQQREAGEGDGWQTHSGQTELGVHRRGAGPGDRFSLPYFSVPDLPAALAEWRSITLNAARNHCAPPGELNFFMARSRTRVGWWEFSARLFRYFDNPNCPVIVTDRVIRAVQSNR